MAVWLLGMDLTSKGKEARWKPVGMAAAGGFGRTARAYLGLALQERIFHEMMGHGCGMRTYRWHLAGKADEYLRRSC